MFSWIWVPQIENFTKDICEFIWITNFQIYMNREIIFRQINFILFQCLNSVVSKFRYIFANGLFDFDFTEDIFANLPWIRWIFLYT